MNKKTQSLLWGILIGILVLWLLNLLLLPVFYEKLTDRGLFGDMFGGLNALFSGLAFWGVIYAILLQSEELSLQREELRLQRQELEKSSNALAQQVAAMNAELEINRKKEAARILSIKPKFEDWELKRKDGSGVDFFYQFQSIYEKQLCSHVQLKKLSGGWDFRAEDIFVSGTAALVVSIILKEGESFNFVLEYADREGNQYEDTFLFDFSTQLFQCLKSLNLADMEK